MTGLKIGSSMSTDTNWITPIIGYMVPSDLGRGCAKNTMINFPQLGAFFKNCPSVPPCNNQENQLYISKFLSFNKKNTIFRNRTLCSFFLHIRIYIWGIICNPLQFLPSTYCIIPLQQWYRAQNFNWYSSTKLPVIKLIINLVLTAMVMSRAMSLQQCG